MRSSLKFNIVNVIIKAVALVSTFIMALVLTPEEYGVIGFVGLWLFYGMLINPGIDFSAQREMAYLLGKGEFGRALHLQNVSVSYNFLYSIIMASVIFISSFLFTDPLIRYGLMITALNYFVSANYKNWGGFNNVRQRFGIAATGALITGTVSPVIIIALVSWLRVYVVLVAPIIAMLFSLVFYLKKDGLDLRFKLDRQTALQLMAAGVPLALFSFFNGAYRFIDRALVAGLLPLGDLGFYTFITSIINSVILLFSDFGNVLQPVLYTNLGKSDNHCEQYSSLCRIGVYLSLSTAITISASQIGFYSLTNFFLTKYAESVPVFNVLAFNIYVLSLSMIPSIILNSTVVNRQKFNTLIWGIGLLLALVLDYAAIISGYGILGVALATIMTQVFITTILFCSVRKYLFREAAESASFMRKIIPPILVSILVFAITTVLGTHVKDPLLFTGLSLAVLGAVWLPIVRIFYKGYFPIEKILRVLKRPVHFISKCAVL